MGYARLLTNGWVDTSFLDTSYNQFAGLINHYYNPYAVNPNDLPEPANYNTPNYVNALAVQPSRQHHDRRQLCPAGRGFLPRRRECSLESGQRHRRSHAGTAITGCRAAGGIGNCPGNVGFTQSSYSVSDTAGSLFVTVNRVNGSLGPVNLVMGTNTLPPGPGAATAADFGLVANGVAAYPQVDSQPGQQYGMEGLRLRIRPQ